MGRLRMLEVERGKSEGGILLHLMHTANSWRDCLAVNVKPLRLFDELVVAYHRLPRHVLAPLAVCLVFTAGAVASFPELDDGYVLLMLKELDLRSLVNAHPDRPLVGWLWYGLAVTAGPNFWP